MISAAALAMLKRILPYAIAVFVVIGALYGAYRHGVSTTTATYEAQIAKDKLASQVALNEVISRNRKLEQDWAASVADMDAYYGKRIKDETSSRDSTIADLQSGSRRMRDRFTCPAGNGGNVPQAAADTGGPARAGAGGLQPADGQFLVREASDATALGLRLNKCIGILHRERGLPLPSGIQGE